MTGLVDTVAKVLEKHMPEILVAVGIGCMGTAAIVAVNSKDEAEKAKVEACDEIANCSEEELSEPKEALIMAKHILPEYADAILVFAVGAACVVVSSKMQFDRAAALASAYALAQDTMQRYASKIVDKFGEKELKKLRSDVTTDKIREHPVNWKKVIDTGIGSTLCFDPFSGRYFLSSAEEVRKAEAELSQELLGCMEVTVNTFYERLGLPTIKAGEYFGWRADMANIPTVTFASQLDEQATPTLTLEYSPVCLAQYSQTIIG